MGLLDGKIALITGASRGIGADIARRFAREGAAVAITARTTEAGQTPLEGTLPETLETIEKEGGRAVAIVANLAKAEDRERVFDEATDQLGAPDILVNNAAVSFFLDADTFPRKRYDLMFEVQTAASFDLAQRAIPAMRERGGGWILNISSGAADHPQGPPFDDLPGNTVYGMVKAAIERFSTGLAGELYDSGIAVNCLKPNGLVLTPGAVYNKIHEHVPEDVHEAPEYMHESALLLCSGDPKQLTGRVVYSQDFLKELGRTPSPL